MTKSKKRNITLIALAACVAGAAAGLWQHYASATRIGFINYQAIQLGQISRANSDAFIHIEEVSTDNLSHLGRYDMLFVNGMGLRITEEQRAQLQAAADHGTPVLTTSATNPQNFIVSVDSVDQEFLKQYLRGADRPNYRSMLRYVRRYVDGKRLFAAEPSDPTASLSSLLYHLDPTQPDGEALAFGSVAAYEAFLQQHQLYLPDAPRVILTGQMGVPDSLIAALEGSGCMVYPVNNFSTFIREQHADTVCPSAIINMAHGRMGDETVAYLTRHNIPLFAPLNVNCNYNDWMADPMGMNGGFLSQSVVTPEIDGAIRPYALFAHFEGSDGLPYVAAIPDRLTDFVATVANYLTLQRKANAEKKVVIFYFKGPGQNALVAEGMEVAPSLYHLLCRLKAEGYRVDGLPASADELEKQINARGRVFGSYAVGAQADFINSAQPATVKRSDYEQWMAAAMPAEMLQEINEADGDFPGHGLHTAEGDIALARLQYGNVVLMPQTAAGFGDDDFKIVHGTNAAPPHAYVAAYLWARYGFGADALIHFGAHGSLEFTPRKQVALSSRDWADRLVGTLPHFYLYSTGNVGEAMTAKRRSYAGIINYLTPPFLESNVRGIYQQLSDAIAAYNRVAYTAQPDAAAVERAARLVQQRTVQLGIHRELRLDSTAAHGYSADDIARIESFAEELANEKITGALYVMGEPYDEAYIRSTVLAMTVDPIAYSLYALDRSRGRAGADLLNHRSRFTELYVNPARALATRLLNSGRDASLTELCALTGLTADELQQAHEVDSAMNGSKDMFARMMVMASSMPAPQPTAKLAERPATRHHKSMGGMSAETALAMAKRMGADEEALKKMEAAMKRGKSSGAGQPGAGHAEAMKAMGIAPAPELSRDERERVNAIMEVCRAVSNITAYSQALRLSPEAELTAVVNALNGGYTRPTAGGDPVLNPAILPTGRNLFAINAEETPSAAAWEKGKSLADNTLDLYRRNHNDSLPRKVSYTLWSSEFIETEGATIAQVLYMLGVEPVRDPFGRVTDLRLIPTAELRRPRIDVVVQTSGQLRDLAASRLFLITRAVEMAAAADDGNTPNYVAQGVVDSERHLVEKGVAPKEARELSTARVFGGVDGNYGSGIQAMVEAGDRWDDVSQVAETYLHNMGAMYGSEAQWEQLRDYAFEAALTNTEVVVQPRQSNTWGALSLDHVYEFMGGMNLAVRQVTGREPEAYLSDYRNRNNVRMQEVKEAIGVESRTTVLNPTYIREKMKGGAGDAGAIADVVRNTYGWNVMKPSVIDNELWDDLYSTYVEDRYNLGTREFFAAKNPAALEEVTAVMLETARKGIWHATDEQLTRLAQLHTELLDEYHPSCSGFVCNNAKLQDFIASKVDASAARQYKAAIGQIRQEETAADGKGMVLKQEDLSAQPAGVRSVVNGTVVALVVIAALIGLMVLVRRRKKNME
jgi:cobaltochelatase CobN